MRRGTGKQIQKGLAVGLALLCLLAGCARQDATASQSIADTRQASQQASQSISAAQSSPLPTPAATAKPAATPAETVEQCVAQMSASIYNGEASVMLYGASKTVFERAYQQVIYDPALFGISGCQYTNSAQGVKVVWSWNCTDYTDRLAAAEAAADEILAGLDPAVSEYEKVRYVHDWLCENVSYVFSPDHADQNIYGALVLRQAVCSGYCNAFRYLLGRLGIQADTISGTDDNGGSHAWNSVVLDGETYYCDVTWDDQETEGEAYISYNWFCITSEEMRRQHTPVPASAMPDSTATAYNYYIFRGWQLDTWDEARLVSILSQQAGGTTLTVRCGDDATYQQMMDVLFTQNEVVNVLRQAGVTAQAIRYSDEPVMRSLTFMLS